MDTAENKKLMEDIFAGLAVCDGRLFVKSLADDVTMRVTGRYSWSRTFQGKASLLRDLYGYVGSRLSEPGKTVPIRFIADGDHVVVEARGDMLTKEGVRYDNEYCLIYRLADGKIVEIREYQDSTLCESILGAFPAPAEA
ncbi:MAG TPA: nuclear transport factor 2 family protein [Rhizomicrobium sp.]